MEVTEADELVFRIIGKESRILDGLDILESSGTSSSRILLPQVRNKQDETKPSTPQKRSQSSPSESQSGKRRKSSSKKTPSSVWCADENVYQKIQSKIELLDLQCQLVRKELELKDKDLHLRDLQIMKLERELNIFTMEETENNEVSFD